MKMLTFSLYLLYLWTKMTVIYTIFIILIVAVSWLFLFRKLGVLDRPWADQIKPRKPVPTMQWLFAYVSLLLIVFFLFPSYFSNPIVLWFLVGSFVIILVELIAELEYMKKISFHIPPFLRLVFHVWAACLALYISWITHYEFILLGNVYVLPLWLLYIAFAWWSVFVINSVNWIDWIYAQGNWILTIWFLTIYSLLQFVVLRYYTEFTNLDVLLVVKQLSLILWLISLVYTFIEYKPLWMMRDVWTMFLAFGLAYLSVIWWTKIGTVIVALSLVVFDAVWIAFYRIFVLKKNPMKGDYTHLHYRLIWLGWSRAEVRAFVWIWSLVMMILMLLQGANRMNKIIIFVLMALIFFGVNIYLFFIKKLPCWLPEKKTE